MKSGQKRTAIAAQITVHMGALLPLVWLVWAIPMGRLGGDPVQELTHYLGLGALRLLLLSLAVSPLVKKFRVGSFNRLRRPLGLWCFVWASLHFSVWMVLDLGLTWHLIGEELLNRTYIVVGFIAWLILLSLCLTSIPRLLRATGKYWKRLHRSVYVVVLLVCLHFYWSVKSGWVEPALYTAIALALLWPRRKAIAAMGQGIIPKNASGSKA